jgi:hypothetical protein
MTAHDRCLVPLGAGEIRRLAANADADPRTVRRVLRGAAVRGMVDRRIREACRRAGIPLATTEGRR